jgi:glutaredoxin 3
MKRVVVYSTRICPYCMMAKRLLASKGVAFEEIRVDSEPGLREELIRRTQRRTVPQIFVGDHHVGGYDDLAALERAGKLDALLAEAA